MTFDRHAATYDRGLWHVRYAERRGFSTMRSGFPTAAGLCRAHARRFGLTLAAELGTPARPAAAALRACYFQALAATGDDAEVNYAIGRRSAAT